MSDIAEHLGKRHDGDHGDVGAPLQLVLNSAAAPVYVADDIAQVVSGRHRLHLHHRLEQDWAGLADALAEGSLGGNFERHRIGVDVMVAAVHQGGSEIHRRIVRQHAVLLLHLETLLDRRHELLRHRPADGFVDEFEAAAALQGLEHDPHFGELTGAAGLLLVDVVLLDLLGDGLPIGHLRLAHDALDTEFGAHAVQGDLEVQLAHAAQNGLPGLAICLQMQ